MVKLMVESFYTVNKRSSGAFLKVKWIALPFALMLLMDIPRGIHLVLFKE